MPKTYTYIVNQSDKVKQASGPVHAALLAQARQTPKGGVFYITHGDDDDSPTTVDLSACNPWKLLALIREVLLDDDIHSGGDMVEAIGDYLDRAGLHA